MTAATVFFLIEVTGQVSVRGKADIENNETYVLYKRISVYGVKRGAALCLSLALLKEIEK
jgi:hypothetical protein